MAFSDLKAISFLKTKMQWHQSRQSVLAQNVSHADTPGYRPNELEALQFAPTIPAPRTAHVAAARTHAAHFDARISEPTPFAKAEHKGWEVRPAGNAVVLEEQMMKVAANQFDYQLASTLYSRSLGLIRSALGRG